MTVFKASEDFFEKEHMEDAHQWTKDTTRRLQKKAKENPNGWQARLLEAYGGHFPVIIPRKPLKISAFERTLDVKKIEEETFKILERW